MHPEHRLADFCLGLDDRDIPEEGRRRAVDAMTDCVGCAVAGSATPLAHGVLKTIHTGADCDSALIGSALRAPAPDAALFNGAAAHAGYAARNGVLAAMLAKNGVDASDAALTHRYGFFQAFNGADAVRPAQFDNWGAPFEIVTQTGIGLKLYPACAATHPAIEAAARHRHKLDGHVSGIRKVRVGMSQFATEPLIYVVPQSPLEAKFSMHFCVAAALARDEVTLGTFSSAGISDPATLALIDKVETYVDERVRDDREFAAVVTVECADGSLSEEMVRVAPGKPERWFTRAQLERKFMDCCAGTAVPERAQRAFVRLQGLDSEMPLSEVGAALAAIGR